MKTYGQRQSRNIEDQRVTPDLSTPVMDKGTSPAPDPTTVSKRKAKTDLARALSATVPMLNLYRK